MPKAARHYRPWTPEDNRQLRRLLKDNTPLRVVASRLRRTVDAVRAQAAKEGIPLRRTKP
jgi:hypothetical protein